MPPLFGSYRIISQLSFLLHGRSKMPSVLMFKDSLYDRCKLYKTTIYRPKEMVKLQRIIGIETVDDCHGIPIHTILIEQFNPAHHFRKRRLSSSVFPIRVMQSLRTIYRHSNQPIIVFEETTPFLCQQRAIGLQTIVNHPTLTQDLSSLGSSRLSASKSWYPLRQQATSLA